MSLIVLYLGTRYDVCEYNNLKKDSPELKEVHSNKIAKESEAEKKVRLENRRQRNAIRKAQETKTEKQARRSGASGADAA